MASLSAQDLEKLFQSALKRHKAGQLHDASQIYTQVLADDPAHRDSLHLLGCIHLARNELDAAIALIGQAAAMEPPQAAMAFNLARALEEAQRFDEAITEFRKADTLAPGDAQTLLGLGNAHSGLKQWQDALTAYDAALRVNPRYAEALLNRALALKNMMQPEEALKAFDQLLAVQPQHAQGLANVGQILLEMKQPVPAGQALTRAWSLPGVEDGVLGNLVRARCETCDWQRLPELIQLLEKKLLLGKDMCAPLSAARFLGQRVAVSASARNRAKGLKPTLPAFTAPPPRPGQRLRVGYVSSDFHANHPVYQAMAGLLAEHDANRFDIHIIQLPHRVAHPLPERLAARPYTFINLQGLSQPEMAKAVRDLALDVAVDVNGYTLFAQTELFTARVAPVQVAYLGFPGTMGGAGHDYIIGDARLIPQSHFADYDESVVWMPHSFFPVDAARDLAAAPPSRAAENLPENAMVFCCFCTHDRISATTFASWMNILKAVPGAVLWLRSGHDATTANLRAAAKAKGISAERLIFAAKTPRNADHLARIALADLALDTLPYNAHMTALDALTAGVPLITQQGETFAGRVAGSLLHAAGLDELILTSRSQLEKHAIALALDVPRRTALRTKLVAARNSAPLFDTITYTRHLEAAFTDMVARAKAGLPPQHFRIDAAATTAPP
jgi:protein O-GlcNAc transferase